MKALLFIAEEWDKSSRKIKPNFLETCQKLSMKYELVDVETESGVGLSTKYGVRNVPTIVFVDRGKVIGIAKGRDSYKDIKKYI